MLHSLTTIHVLLELQSPSIAVPRRKYFTWVMLFKVHQQRPQGSHCPRAHRARSGSEHHTAVVLVGFRIRRPSRTSRPHWSLCQHHQQPHQYFSNQFPCCRSTWPYPSRVSFLPPLRHSFGMRMPFANLLHKWMPRPANCKVHLGCRARGDSRTPHVLTSKVPPSHGPQQTVTQSDRAIPQALSHAPLSLRIRGGEATHWRHRYRQHEISSSCRLAP